MIEFLLYDVLFMASYVFVSFMICTREGYQFRKPLRQELERGLNSLAVQLPFSNMAMQITPFGQAWGPLACIRYLVCFDALVFWIHLALHRNHWLYDNVHKEHHRTIWVSPFSATILDWREHLLVGVVPTVLPLFFIDLSFGAWTMMNMVIFLYGMAIHSSLPIPGAREHATHHVFKNTHFGFMFSIWDTLLGTSTYPITREKLVESIIANY